DTKYSIVCQYSIRAVALLNPGGAIAQFQRNDCSISPVEVIWRGGVRKRKSFVLNSYHEKLLELSTVGPE
ncbi:MAG: hypothetical protein MR803_00495, partial [Clostridiales bacterium]|nr:hypothetical protein [Clostridiales bacterium]